MCCQEKLQRCFNDNITTLIKRHNYLIIKPRFSDNITTWCRRLLIDVFFATLLQGRDMVEQRRDVKAIKLQRCHDGLCLLGYVKKFSKLNIKYNLMFFENDVY